MLSVNPHPPARRRGKVRETYKSNIKSFTDNTNHIDNKRNNAKHTKPTLSLSKLGAGVLVSRQQLPGSTR